MLRAGEALYGLDSEQVLQSKYNLFQCLCYNKQHEEGEMVVKDLILQYERLLGENDIQTLEVKE